MKNRDRYLLKVNEYDLILRIFENTKSCPIKALTGKMDLERCQNYNKTASRKKNCSNCMQAWLNEEA